MNADWFHRKQAWQPYDSSVDGNEWQGEAILKFLDGHTFPPPAATACYPSSFPRILKKLFAFLPIDMNGIIPTDFELDQPCFICKQPFKGHTSQQFSSTVLTLHCNHSFHLICITNEWDQEGKYLQRCPKCRFTTKLNFESVGINPTDKFNEPFAHNVWEYKEAAKAWAKFEAGDTDALDFYDIPPENPASGPLQSYWETENEGALATSDLFTFAWKKVTFQAGQQTTMLRRSAYAAHENNAPFNTVVRSMTSQLAAYILSNSRNPDGVKFTPNDTNTKRVLEAAVSTRMPKAEAARMRAARRRRDRERRMTVSQEGINRITGAFESRPFICNRFTSTDG